MLDQITKKSIKDFEEYNHKCKGKYQGLVYTKIIFDL